MGNITSKVEVITPETAKVYLDHNVKNRSENKGHVAFLAKMMTAGEWQVNGEAIVFDENGDLVNGQHRLKACILANVPFTTMVVRGVQPETFYTFDSGCGRKVAQVFQIADIPNSTTVSSIISNYCKIRTSKTNSLEAYNRVGSAKYYVTAKISNAELLEIYNNDMDFWQNTFKVASGWYGRCRLLTKTQLGSILAFLVKEKGYAFDFVSDFFDQLFYDELTQLECVRTLRNRLIDDAMAGAKVKMSIVYKEQLLILCWENYKQGKDSKVLRWSPNIDKTRRWE